MLKVIKYYLDNGSIPDYVVTEKNGQKCSGLWQNTDMSLIGLGDVTESEPGVTTFNTVEALIAYMKTYLYNAKTLVFNNDNATTSYVPFDVELAANSLWDLCNS
jgi:hypothetical protein